MGNCGSASAVAVDQPLELARATSTELRRSSTLVEDWKKQSTGGGDNLYEEHQRLLQEAGATYADLAKSGFSSGDCLLVVDMQNDFLPASDAPNGGRFGVADGGAAAVIIVGMIEAAAKAGTVIVATRDYHPKNHCSFNTATPPGPYPPHCIQGHAGSFFYPPIEQALKDAKNSGADVRVVFKGFVADVDSYGGSVPYDSMAFEVRGLGHGQATAANKPICGACALDWTGAFCLECSNMDEDLNAPPDVMSVFSRMPLKETLSKTSRLFCVGLAMDFCVCDSAANAATAGVAKDNVFLVCDAARAAHIPGIGQFGSGFLTDPKSFVELMKHTGVQLMRSDTLF